MSEEKSSPLVPFTTADIDAATDRIRQSGAMDPSRLVAESRIIAASKGFPQMLEDNCLACPSVPRALMWQVVVSAFCIGIEIGREMSTPVPVKVIPNKETIN